MTEYVQVMTTTGTEGDANAIARTLVEERLAGCVQVIGPITSTYRWNDGIETAREWLCLIKTSGERYGDVEARIRELHAYEVPEVLAVPVVAGSSTYLEWLDGGLARIGE